MVTLRAFVPSHLARPFFSASLLAGLACGTPTAAVAPPVPAPPTAPLRLTIAGTNDWHGWAQPHQAHAKDGSTVDEGGLALYASVLKQLRQETGGRLLVLDAGDIFQGTLVSNLSEGAVMVDAFNALGVDAVAVGNHEFDYGPVGPAVVPASPGDDPVGALKARIAQAQFPFLAANVVETSTGAPPAWLKGTAIRDVGGVRVGIIGLITPETPNTTNPVNVAGLRFLPLAPTAKAAAEKLRAQGAQVVVVVAHAGGKCEDLRDPHDVTKCNSGEEIFAMLNQLPPGTVDAVVAGHTHRAVGHFVNGTPVIETSALGRSFGLISLELDPSTRRPLAASTRIEAEVPLCERVVEGTARCDASALEKGKPLVAASFHGQPLHPDAAMEQRLAPALAAVAQVQAQPLGVEVPVTLRREGNGESALGSATADALRRWKVQTSGFSTREVSGPTWQQGRSPTDTFTRRFLSTTRWPPSSSPRPSSGHYSGQSLPMAACPSSPGSSSRWRPVREGCRWLPWRCRMGRPCRTDGCTGLSCRTTSRVEGTGSRPS